MTTDLLSSPSVGIGVHDVLSGIMAQKAQADFAWVSSFSVSASHGVPDRGLVDASEMLRLAAELVATINVPVVLDMDSGYGPPEKIYKSVRAAFAAGVAGVCIEDNVTNKVSSLYPSASSSKPLASQAEHIERICAAAEARGETKGLVIARTEALVANMGTEEALERCAGYSAVGADAVFVQAIQRDSLELFSFLTQWQRRTPVFLAPTAYPQYTFDEFFRAGASHCIFANQYIRAIHAALNRASAYLTSSIAPLHVADHLSTVAELSEEMGVALPSGFLDA